MMENLTHLTEMELVEIMDYFDIEESTDIEPSEDDWEHYGLKKLSIDGDEYAIGTDDEADAAVKEYIEDSVWAFTPWFLADHLKVDMDADDIEHMQKKCESSNDFFLSAIEDMDEFVEDAISADGRGHFLNGYDSEEIEIGDLFLYRTD